MDRDEAFDAVIGVAAGVMLHIGENTYHGQRIREALEVLIGKTELDILIFMGEEVRRLGL